MSTIVFIDPTRTPRQGTGQYQYDPVHRPWDFSHIPEVPGVYIWGMKVVVDGKEYFAPWNVGEGKLRNRLETHYFGLFSRGAYNEELFDFSALQYTKYEIKALYDSMEQYDRMDRSEKLLQVVNIPKLIFWQDNRFLYHKCTDNFHNVAPYNIKDQSAIMPGGLLDRIHAQHPGSNAMSLKARIESCKRNFDHGFQFFYCLHKSSTSTSKADGMDKTKMRSIEHAVKSALKQLHVHTTAKATGSFGPTKVQFPKETNLIHDLWNEARTREVDVP